MAIEGPVNPQTPPGVPTPTQNQPVVDKPSGNSNGNPDPRKVSLDEFKNKLLRPALTSHFQCWFNPPTDVRDYLRKNRRFDYDNRDNLDLISLSCTETSLPGSSLVTNEINDDYTGVTERLAYRRQYDDRIDFTFYVDNMKPDGINGNNNTVSGNYNVIWFFENWIQYISNEQWNEGDGMEQANYNYRFRFPDGKGGTRNQGYRTTIYINKFEKDFAGSYLRYRFIKAYPISIDSMPVSYDSAELLKCTVSFTYLRYVIDRIPHTEKYVYGSEPERPNIKGIPSPEDQKILDLMRGENVPTNEELRRLGYSVSNAPEPTIRRSVARSQDQIRNNRLGL